MTVYINSSIAIGHSSILLTTDSIVANRKRSPQTALPLAMLAESTKPTGSVLTVASFKTAALPLVTPAQNRHLLSHPRCMFGRRRPAFVFGACLLVSSFGQPAIAAPSHCLILLPPSRPSLLCFFSLLLPTLVLPPTTPPVGVETFHRSLQV